MRWDTVAATAQGVKRTDLRRVPARTASARFERPARGGSAWDRIRFRPAALLKACVVRVADSHGPGVTPACPAVSGRHSPAGSRRAAPEACPPTLRAPSRRRERREITRAFHDWRDAGEYSRTLRAGRQKKNRRSPKDHGGQRPRDLSPEPRAPLGCYHWHWAVKRAQLSLVTIRARERRLGVERPTACRSAMPVVRTRYE